VSHTLAFSSAVLPEQQQLIDTEEKQSRKLFSKAPANRGFPDIINSGTRGPLDIIIWGLEGLWLNLSLGPERSLGYNRHGTTNSLAIIITGTTGSPDIINKGARSPLDLIIWALEGLTL